MKLSKIFLVFSIVALLTQTLSVGAFAADEKNDLILSKRLIKENLVLTRTLADLNSETAKPCDKLQLKTLDNIDCGNKVIIPCGSILEGKVVKVRKSSIFRTNAYIDLLITNIKTNSCCNICFEKDPLKLRIVDPHYKTFIRGAFQRAPASISGTASSIVLSTATNLSGGVITAIGIGAELAAGFVSGFIDPDIDKTRVDGGIIRGVEGTPLGSILITVERGFEINSPTCCYVTIRLDDKARQKIICSMQRAVAASNNF